MALDSTADTLVAPGATNAAPSGAASLEAAPVDPTVASRPRIGGRYEILGLLGSGGMGNVYRARDVELDEVVALKVLRPEVAGEPGALDRFRLEVKLARRVTHPNVARVFDLGDAGGERFLTMELVDGEPLSAVLAREGRLGARRVAELASAICAGLGAAHAAGVVHRDLKPDNVLIGKDGRVVVTDFGIARALAAGHTHTVSGFLGTPAYMAPEQLEQGVAIDARADLYALGAMLYELLVGERPWQGDSIFAVACARLLRPPPDPREKRPDLAPAVAAVVLRCMARSREDRPATAADVAAALIAATSASVSTTPIRAIDPAALPRDAGAKHVAVLPFRNLGLPEHAYLAEGLTEELIDLLSMAAGLRVRSRGMVMRYQGSDRDPRDVGRELDVQVVVEGSVRRGAEGVRISARLVSVHDGVQLWARRFDRPEADLLAVSDDAARAISEALTVELGAPARTAPDNPEALDLYFQARAAYHAFGAIFSNEPAELFARALVLAPNDPRILAGFAMARARRWVAEPEAARDAREAAERAAALGPGLPETHIALAALRIMSGDEAGAVSPLRRALRLAPRHAEAHDLLGRALIETHATDAGTRHLEIALSLHPGLELARITLARSRALQGDWEATDRIIAGAPEATRITVLGRLLPWRPDAAQAAAQLPAFEATTTQLKLARAYIDMVVSGIPAYPALPTAPDPTKLPMRLRAFMAQLEAETAAYLGDHARALDAIDRADAGMLVDIAWLDACPLFAPLRGEARFAAARVRIGERAARIVEQYLAPEVG